MTTARFSARARADAFAIWDDLATSGDRFGTSPDDPVDSADAFAAELSAACRAVLDAAVDAVARDDLGPGIREYPGRGFRLFYRARPDGVDIVRVVSNAIPD
jgi:plasmid stabilization system protein ParE